MKFCRDISGAREPFNINVFISMHERLVQFLVDRLVAETFPGMPPPEYVIEREET